MARCREPFSGGTSLVQREIPMSRAQEARGAPKSAKGREAYDVSPSSAAAALRALRRAPFLLRGAPRVNAVFVHLCPL